MALLALALLLLITGFLTNNFALGGLAGIPCIIAAGISWHINDKAEQLKPPR